MARYENTAIQTIIEFLPHIKDANQLTGTITTATTTTLKAAVSGQTIKVFDYFIWNNGAANVEVTLKYGTSGKIFFDVLLLPNQGLLKTFVRSWESNANDSLVIVTSVNCTVAYSVGAVQS
jgi:hypothetical protein